jgi:hypothetical protein
MTVVELCTEHLQLIMEEAARRVFVVKLSSYNHKAIGFYGLEADADP